MSMITMCRICLSTDVRMYNILNTPLQKIYEKNTLLPLSPETKSTSLCYICHSKLKRCYILTQQALRADEILNKIISGHLVSDTINQQSFCISQIESIDILENDNKLEIEVPVKCEIPVKCEDKGDDEKEDEHLDLPSHHSSSSDDDIPLQQIRVIKKAKNTVRMRKKEQKELNKGYRYIADFAKEIILTKDEQLKELAERAKSLNYVNSPLKCELCFKGFVDTRAFDNHMEKHNECSGPHECSICRMRYISTRQLRTHMINAHERRYQCERCEHRSHTANQAREHEKWHSGYTYECKLCAQVFRKPTSYLTHMRKRHPTPHVCNICGESFVGRHGLLMHKTKAHRHDKPPTETNSEPPSTRFCSECNIQFLNVDAWKRHILSSLKHTLSTDNSPQCKICSMRFTSSSSLSLHLREHDKALRAARGARLPTKPIQLQCDQCDSHFVNRSKLQAHVRRKHLGFTYNKNIVCEVCGKKCTSVASLKYHQRTHTGEKPFQCTSCSKYFADKNQLRIHTRTHTGERPYCCSTCGKRFSQKPALNRHYRVHNGEKPYLCQLCSKTFSQSNSLKLHIRTVHLKMTTNRKKTENAGTQDTVSLQAL